MASEQSEVDLRDDRIVIADDPRKEGLAGLEQAQEVVAEFVLDGLGLPAAIAEIWI